MHARGLRGVPMRARWRGRASLLVPALMLVLASTQDGGAAPSSAMARNPQFAGSLTPPAVRTRPATEARVSPEPWTSPEARPGNLGSIGSAAGDSLALLEQREQKTSTELSNLARAEELVRQRLIVRGRVLYRLARAGTLPAGSGFSAFVEHAMRLGRARWSLDQDLGRLKRITDQKTELSRQLEEIAIHKAPLQLEKEAAIRARVMIEEAEDRRRAFEHAFERSTGASDYVAVYGGGVGPDDPSTTADTFRVTKGRLPFPVAGRVEVKVVKRENANGPGVEMSAPEGTVVRAVFPGRVAFADRYDGFGPIVILDHGDRYYTLMGNLGAIDVRVGDDLSAGARVGIVGQGPSGPALYFEIRKGASTLDPKPWFGI